MTHAGLLFLQLASIRACRLVGVVLTTFMMGRGSLFTRTVSNTQAALFRYRPVNHRLPGPRADFERAAGVLT